MGRPGEPRAVAHGERVPAVADLRYTVIDEQGSVSFVGPGHILKMLVAGCAAMPPNLPALLEHLRRYDADYATRLADGLAVFDEHHIGQAAPIEPAASTTPLTNQAPPAALDGVDYGDRLIFRVIDAASRQVSLQPAAAGVILFNLVERRIIQLQNSYGEIERQGRGRLRRKGRPVQTFYFYALPESWRLLP